MAIVLALLCGIPQNLSRTVSTSQILFLLLLAGTKKLSTTKLATFLPKLAIFLPGNLGLLSGENSSFRVKIVYMCWIKDFLELEDKSIVELNNDGNVCDVTVVLVINSARLNAERGDWCQPCMPFVVVHLLCLSITHGALTLVPQVYSIQAGHKFLYPACHRFSTALMRPYRSKQSARNCLQSITH